MGDWGLRGQGSGTMCMGHMEWGGEGMLGVIVVSGGSFFVVVESILFCLQNILITIVHG